MASATWGKYKPKVQSSKSKVATAWRWAIDDWSESIDLEKARKPQIVNRKFERVAKNIVYFDLETQKSAVVVGGWGHINRMGMSVGVTFSTGRGDYKIYGEKQVDDLLKDLQRADLVVGFNILRFDYEVLHGYTSFDLRQLPTLDLMVDLQNKLQHRLSLDSIATATFGVEKTAEGMQAIRWFKERRLLEIAEYCCYDVKITKLVHEYGQQRQQVHYHNRFGKKMTVPVSW